MCLPSRIFWNTKFYCNQWSVPKFLHKQSNMPNLFPKKGPLFKQRL